nr:MAG TPA: hypothetical protein [Caudoviricetes sp.]
MSPFIKILRESLWFYRGWDIPSHYSMTTTYH